MSNPSLQNPNSFPLYFQEDPKSTEGENPNLDRYAELIEQIRENSQKRLELYNGSFQKSDYITNSPSDISKKFAINGALKIDFNELDDADKLIVSNSNLFRMYRNSVHTRSGSFYEYELPPSMGVETEYLDKLESKIKHNYKFLSDYQSQIASKGKVSLEQWQILYALLDNYNLCVTQLFNAISYNTMIRGNSNNQLDQIKIYYQALTDSVYSIHSGNKINKIPELEINFAHIRATLDSETQKPIDREILRGVPESNSHLFNNIWADSLAEEILEENLDKNEEIFLVGLHFGGIQMPFILSNKLKKLGYTNIKTVSCHYSSKNEYKDEEFPNLFGINTANMKSKKVVLVDDGIVAGKGLFLVADFLKNNLGADVKVSVEYLIRQEGESYKYGIVDTDFLESIPSISRVSPFSRIRSQGEKTTKRTAGTLRLIDRFANRMLSSNNPIE